MAKKKSSGWGGRRPGAGAKPVLNDPRRLAVQLERAVYEALAELAKREELPVGVYARRVLTKHAERRA